jgi:hypothetical protein
MFSSKKSILLLDDIPSQWIFKYYLKLSDDAFTRTIRLKSLFNPRDSNPSMYVYYDRFYNKWVYKCHSTGKFGDGISLVQVLFNISYNDACDKVIEDYYNSDKSDFNMLDENELGYTKWFIDNYKVRAWTVADANYWLAYNIGTTLLNKYNVFPLESYELTQKNLKTNEIVKSIRFENTALTYAFMTEDKQIYKVYSPKNKSKKFICLEAVIQGVEQLDYHDTMVITSSLKDVMAIKSLGFRVDCIAPSSESTKLRPEIINDWLKKEYKHIVVYMDSDIAGINAMKFYEENYNLPFVYLPREKDISDIIKIHGRQTALYDLYPKLQNAIEKYIEKNP